MRNLMVVLAILVLSLLPLPVQAQNPVPLASVSVDLWPEYDQPSLLTIYHIQLPQNAKLPTTLSLRIPAGAQVNAVAVIDPTKGLINAPYQSASQGDWTTLSITTTSLQVQVEYYVPLQKNGTTRQVTFVWPADDPVETLDINFLLPPSATDPKITPSPVTSAPGQGGLTNYVIRQANPPVGTPVKVTIEYQRQTDELGISSLPVQAISTPGTSTPGLTSTPSILPWALGGLGVLLVAGGLFGFFGWRRGGSTMRKAQARASAAPEPENETVYCSECGKRAQPGDIFCRTCGARLQSSES